MYKPKLNYTDKMVSRMMEIEKTSVILKERRLPSSWTNEKQESVLYKNISDSLKLENILFDSATVKEILKSDGGVIAESDRKVVENYSDAIKYIDGLIEYSGSMLNVGDVKEINQFSLQDNQKADWHRGKLREIQNWVVDPTVEEIVFTAPSPELVPQMLNELILWLKTDADVHPLLKAGIAHHRFMFINPFVQANERTACLIEKYILLYKGYFADNMICMSGYYSDDISLYYSKLLSGLNDRHTDEKNLTEWLDYFLTGLHSQITALADETKSFEVDKYAAEKPSAAQIVPGFEDKESSAPTEEQIDGLNERQRLILQIGEKYSTFHRRDIISEMELAGRYHPKTISRDLKSLVDTGFLKQSGERKGIRYSLSR